MKKNGPVFVLAGFLFSILLNGGGAAQARTIELTYSTLLW